MDHDYKEQCYCRTWRQKQKAQRGRKPVYKSDDPRCTVTYNLTESQKNKLKAYALGRGMTVSAVLGEFVDRLEITTSEVKKE